MFDLDRAIDQWCQQVIYGATNTHSKRTQRQQAAMDELKDHLYCEVEQAMQRGLDSETAFHEGIDRLGSCADLKQEYAKNNPSRLSGCLVNESSDELGSINMTDEKFALVHLAGALVWATLFIVSAVILSGSAYAKPIYFLQLTLVMLYYSALYGLMPKNRARQEWSCIMKLLKHTKR